MSATTETGKGGPAANYNLYGPNCTKFVEHVLAAGGVSAPDRTTPWILFKDLQRQYTQPISILVQVDNGPPVDLNPSLPIM